MYGDLTATIIGMGRMGVRHLQMLKKLGIETISICDQQAESLDRAGREYGIPEEKRFRSFQDAISSSRPDLAIVATTADSHCSLTCLAAQSGAKYVLCEKPMACSISDCDKMIDVCRAAGTMLAINHPMRFMETYTKVKQILESESFGGLLSMTVVGGNFGLAMNGTHFFEAFRFLTGEEPNEVSAWLDYEEVPNPRGKQFEDRGGSVRAITRSGERLYIECGPRQGHRIMVTYAGPRGQLVVDHLTGSALLTVRDEEHRDFSTTRYDCPSIDSRFEIGSTDIVDAAANVTKALIAGSGFPSGEDGRLAIRTLVSAHVSSERGHIPVEVQSSDLPLERAFPWA